MGARPSTALNGCRNCNERHDPIGRHGAKQPVRRIPATRKCRSLEAYGCSAPFAGRSTPLSPHICGDSALAAAFPPITTAPCSPPWKCQTAEPSPAKQGEPRNTSTFMGSDLRLRGKAPCKAVRAFGKGFQVPQDP
jgi:hypothetical protein